MSTRLCIADADMLVEPEGPHLDVGSAEEFRAALTDALSSEGKLPERIILDLGRVVYLDSAGLGAMISVLKRARRFGIPLTLRSVRPEVRDLLDLTLISRIFEFESEREGVHAGGREA